MLYIYIYIFHKVSGVISQSYKCENLSRILVLFFLCPCTAIKVPGTSRIKANTKQAHVHKLASTQQPHL